MGGLKKGDFIRVRQDGTSDDWCEGFIAIASETSTPRQSVMLVLNGIVRCHGGFLANGLPLNIDYAKESVTGLDGTSYEIEVLAVFETMPGDNFRFVVTNGQQGIQCSFCQRTSYNPNDVIQRYCGHCHTFLWSDPNPN